MEDFGFGGDESFLSPHQFALEVQAIQAMKWEEERRALSEEEEDIICSWGDWDAAHPESKGEKDA